MQRYIFCCPKKSFLETSHNTGAMHYAVNMFIADRRCKLQDFITGTKAAEAVLFLLQMIILRFWKRYASVAFLRRRRLSVEISCPTEIIRLDLESVVRIPMELLDITAVWEQAECLSRFFHRMK